jgi:hypothetical protein
MGLGALLIVIGIVVVLIGSDLLGILLIIVGLLLGGFRRGHWY